MKVAVAFLALATIVALSNAHNYKKVCYFANWAVYRQGDGAYWVNDLDPFECTHLNYAFAVLNNRTYLMQAHDPPKDIDQGGFAKFVALKQRNPALKTLIALGGWNDSHFSTQYSEMANNPALRAAFIADAVKFIQQWGFDGLDLDWEYPGEPGLPEDKQNFILLLKELREAFNKINPPLLLTMAPSCSIRQALISYDIPEMAKYVDYINFMGYDIHGAWENYTDHQAPLYRRPWDLPNDPIIDESVTYWLNQGMPKEKLIFGIPAYGRSFHLVSKDSTAILAPADGPGWKGQYTGEDGFISFYEICEYIQRGWSVTVDRSGSMGPYAHNTTDWVGYDDIEAVIRKVNYAMNRNLGGIMVWEVGLDDFRNKCGMGPRPILRAVEATLSGQGFNAATPPPPISPPATEPPRSCTTEGALFANPSDCRKYYACYGGILTEGSCPSFGVNQAFNQNTKICDSPSNVPGCANCCNN